MEISDRAMRADQVPQVEALYKLAFRTEFQLSDPTAIRGDAGLVYTPCHVRTIGVGSLLKFGGTAPCPDACAR